MQFFQNYKKQIAILLIVLALIGAAYYLYQKHQLVPMATIPNTTPSSVATGQLSAGAFKSMEDAKVVSKAIEKRIQTEPDVVYMTNTQQEADKKANAIAKQDGADYMLKKTTTETVSEDTKNSSSTNSDTSTQIKNEYYGVHTNKEYRLMAGVTSIDGTMHFTTGVQAKRVSVLIHSKDLRNIDGASVLYTVLEK
jgi:hypothetical protein